MEPYQGLQQVSFAFWQKPVLKNSNGEFYVPGIEGLPEATNPWDYVLVSDTKTPGVCEVECEKSVSVDRKKAVGGAGERLTLHGMKASEFTIRIKVWTPEQLRRLKNLWIQWFIVPMSIPPVVTSKNVIANPQAPKNEPFQVVTVTSVNRNPNNSQIFDLQHPVFAQNNVHSGIFTGGSGPVISGGIGVFTIRGLEYTRINTSKSLTKTPVQPLSSRFDPGANAPPGNNPADVAP